MAAHTVDGGEVRDCMPQQAGGKNFAGGKHCKLLAPVILQVIRDKLFVSVLDEQVWQAAFPGGHHHQMAYKLGMIVKIEIVLHLCRDLAVVSCQYEKRIIEPDS